MRTGRPFVLAATVLLAVVLLAACGAPASSDNAPASTPTTPATTPAPQIAPPVSAVATTALVDAPAPTSTTVPPGTLDPGPLHARTDASRVWTGTELVVWGGVDLDGNPLGDGAAYEPAAHTWRTLPGAGWMASVTDALWDGRGILALGVSTLTEVEVTRWTATALAPPPYPDTFDVEWFTWTGESLVVWLFDYSTLDTAVWQYDRGPDAWHRVTGTFEAGVAVGPYVVGIEQADPNTTGASPVAATVTTRAPAA